MMITQADLRQILSRVSVDDLAKEAGVATKTIYRIRQGKTGTTLATVEKLLGAIRRLEVLGKGAA